MTFLETVDWRIPNCMAWEGSESSLQVEIITRSLAMVHDHPKVLRLHAIPNGGWRGMREGMKLKAEGVRPGIPDLCLPVVRAGFHGLYMELKNAKGKVKHDQWEVMEELHDEGYCVRLCNDPVTALNLIEDYLNAEAIRSADKPTPTTPKND